MLLFGRHRVLKQMGSLPALIHNDSETQITDAKFFPDDAHGHDVLLGTTKFLRYPEGTQAKLIGRPYPVPWNAFFCCGQAVAAQYVGFDDLF